MNITLQDIQFRRNTSTYYTTTNPVLLLGEPAFEVDTFKLKIGNGVDQWVDLPYVSGTSGSGGNIISVNGKTGTVVLNADDINDASTAHKFVTSSDLTKLANLSGTNTGDQDISGIATNANAISAIESVQFAQNNAIALNTAKVSYPGPQDADEVPVSPAVNGNTNVQAVLADHESRIVGLAAGGSDGVVTNVALSGTNLNFTGSGGGFNGTIDLSSLGGGSSSSLATDDQTLTALRRINLGESSPNSLFIYGTESDTGINYLYSFGTTGAVFNRSLQILNNNNISMGSGKITGVGNPTDNNDAANKVYVDNAVAGITNTQDGSDIVLTGYTKGSDDSAVAATDTANEAFAKLENQIDNISIIGNNNDFFTGQQLTNGYQITGGNFATGRTQLWYNGSTDIQIVLPSDVADAGEKLVIWQYGTGKVGLALGSGVNGLEFQTIDNESPITLTRTFDNTFGYRPVGAYNSYTGDLTPPTTTTATVENSDLNALVVVFNEPVTITNVNGLTLNGDFIDATITGINSGSGTSTLNLALSRNVANGEAGSLVYSGSNTIIDNKGNALAAGSIAITNNVGAAGTQLHTVSNAASDPNGNESNSTAGWTTSVATLTSVTSPKSTGSYAIEVTANAQFASFAEFPINFTTGDVITVTFWCRQTVGSNGEIHVTGDTANITGEPLLITPSPTGQNYSYTLTATGNGTIQWRFYASNGGNIGDKVVFDNFSAIRQ